jgi:uncharacterized membrane protein YccC
MNNKIKTHLKAIGTMLAVVGVSTVLVLLPPNIVLSLILLAPASFIYWIIYEMYSHKKNN